MSDTPTGAFDEQAIDQFTSSEVDWSGLFSGTPDAGFNLKADPVPEEWERINKTRWQIERSFEEQREAYGVKFVADYDAGTQDITRQLALQGVDTGDLRLLHTLVEGLILFDHFTSEELDSCGVEKYTGGHASKHVGLAQARIMFWLRQRLIECGAPPPHAPEETDGGAE